MRFYILILCIYMQKINLFNCRNRITGIELKIIYFDNLTQKCHTFSKCKKGSQIMPTPNPRVNVTLTPVRSLFCICYNKKTSISFKSYKRFSFGRTGSFMKISSCLPFLKKERLSPLRLYHTVKLGNNSKQYVYDI